MEADNRELNKIYFYDYDLVIQELVPAQPDLPVTTPNFSQPINSAWGSMDSITNNQYTIKPADTDGDAKKKKGKKQLDAHPVCGSIPGFEG